MSNWKNAASAVGNLFSPSAKRTKSVEAMGANNMPQALKRKADPYELPEEGEDLAVATPAGRTRSRRTSEAPSSIKSKPSASKSKRQSAGKRLSSAESAQPATQQPSQPNTEAQANRDNAEPSRAPMADMGGAPVADMGGTEFLTRQPEPKKKILAHRIAENKAPLEQHEDNKADGEKPAKRDAQESLAEKIEEEDVHEVKKLLKHKESDTDPGHVVLLVQWVNDPEETWEPEEEIQNGASELLFDYWKKQKSRSAALFEGSKALLREQYFVYKILNHERARSIFQFQVQWVGYPADKTQTSIETETKLKKIAPELLQEYWDVKGGRDQFLAKRGRVKKLRSE